MFCKTKAVDCLSKFNYNGKTYENTCTSDSIDKSDKKEEFFWCATEVDEKNNEMVHWGVCDLSTCKYNISCLFTKASIYQIVQTFCHFYDSYFFGGFAKVTFINDKMSDYVEL